MGWSPSIGAFAVVRFVGGAAGAMAIVVATAMAVEVSVATGRSALLAIHFAGVGTGIVASAALVAFLSANGASWREGWVCAGLLSSGCAFCVWLLSTEFVDPRVSGQSSTRSEIHPSFRRLAIANGLSAFGYVTVATFLVVMVRRIPSAVHLEGWVWIVFGLATGPSILFWNAVVRATSLPTALVLAYLTEAVGVAASLAESSTIGMLIAATCVGATFMANTSLGMLAARKLWRGDLRRPIGVMTAFFGIGQIVGPAVSGYLSDRTGGFFLPSMIALFGLLVGASLVASIRGELLKD
jgi:predicted MFS family arabinose efflux permease